MKPVYLIPNIMILLIFVRASYARYVEDLDKFSASSCGMPKLHSGRVIGGDEAKSKEFPWIVSIQSKEGQHFCAGFMVSSRYLISAAHCFSETYNHKNLKYNQGEVILDSMVIAISLVKLDSSDTTKMIGVKRLIMHPDYEEKVLNHDIAILELQRDLEWTDDFSPICLPDENDLEGKTDATVAGWGYRQCDSFNASNELHKITVPVWKADECQKSYQDAAYDFYNRRDFVCAGGGLQDISKGDSGGPLMHRRENKWTAIGIVSSGRFMCSDRVPGVYTKVSSYVQWIKSQIE